MKTPFDTTDFQERIDNCKLCTEKELCDGCVIRKEIVFQIKRLRKEVEEVIDEMIVFSQNKRKELKNREADLIEIVPHLDYIAVLEELKSRLFGKEKKE